MTRVAHGCLHRLPGPTRVGQSIRSPIGPYWAPLTTLTYGVLGRSQPDLGVQRWISAGRPTDTPQLMVLDRWWGEHALALTSWAQVSDAPAQYSAFMAEKTGAVRTQPISTQPVRALPEWREVTTGGGDPLHLGHVLEHLLGPTLDAREAEGRFLHDSHTGPQREASLLLDRYCGWYAALTRYGTSLPQRPDSQSWLVHVTVKPVGYLGTYRRSRETGRWFAGRHAHHMLGWPG
jgi:hypothetical protein